MSSSSVKDDAGRVTLLPPRRVLFATLQSALLICATLVTACLLYHAFIVALGGSQDNNWGAARALLQGHDMLCIYAVPLAAGRLSFRSGLFPTGVGWPDWGDSGRSAFGDILLSQARMPAAIACYCWFRKCRSH